MLICSMKRFFTGGGRFTPDKLQGRRLGGLFCFAQLASEPVKAAAGLIDAVVIPPWAAPPARVVAPDGVANGRHKDAEVTMMPPAEIVTVPHASAMPAATAAVEVAAMEITVPAKISVARPIPATPSWSVAASVHPESGMQTLVN
jgi:hypothetical protein